jgi:hypothetical protein
MGTAGAEIAGRRTMSYVGRAIGLFVLCVLVGLLLDRLGVSAHGIIHDTWRTVGGVIRKLSDIMNWALPYALLGAVIVVPIMVMRYIGHRRGSR